MDFIFSVDDILIDSQNVVKQGLMFRHHLSGYITDIDFFIDLKEIQLGGGPHLLIEIILNPFYTGSGIIPNEGKGVVKRPDELLIQWGIACQLAKETVHSFWFLL